MERKPRHATSKPAAQVMEEYANHLANGTLAPRSPAPLPRRPTYGDTWPCEAVLRWALFSAAERDWNEEFAAALRNEGHEVFLPQDKERGLDAARIFSTDVGGIDWADALVAIMDGPEPDAGTAWEVGYAYGKKPIVLVRTDIRARAGSSGPYSPMLREAATILLDLPFASMARLVAAVLDALRRVEEGSR